MPGKKRSSGGKVSKKKDRSKSRVARARTETRTEHKNDEVRASKKPASKKPVRFSYDEVSKWKTIAFVFFILFMISFVYGHKIFSNEFSIPSSEDELIYITSSACASCGQYEETMQHLAALLDAKYRKVEYINPVSFPGFVLISNGTLSIAGFNDRMQLLEFICRITSNRDVCEEYNLELNKKVNKTDVPLVRFFVMSFCPFGQQMEKVINSVYEVIGDKAIFEPHYVIYSGYGGYPDYCLDEDERYCSLHGIQELREDVRQLCIWKYYNSSIWWEYVMKINEKCSAKNVDECWEPIAKDIGIDVEKINSCLENEANALLERELRLNKEYNVRGSPTVFINEELYRGARNADAFKQALCARFTSPPAECGQSMPQDSSAEETNHPPSGSCGG